MDLANHVTGTKTPTSWDGSRFDFVAGPGGKVAGDDIMISYGDDKPTMSFLLNYGFLPSSNFGDFFTLVGSRSEVESKDAGGVGGNVDSAAAASPPLFPSGVSDSVVAQPEDKHSRKLVAPVGPDGRIPYAFFKSCARNDGASNSVDDGGGGWDFLDESDGGGASSSSSGGMGTDDSDAEDGEAGEGNPVEVPCNVVQRVLDSVKKAISDFPTSLQDDKTKLLAAQSSAGGTVGDDGDKDLGDGEGGRESGNGDYDHMLALQVRVRVKQMLSAVEQNLVTIISTKADAGDSISNGDGVCMFGANDDATNSVGVDDSSNDDGDDGNGGDRASSGPLLVHRLLDPDILLEGHVTLSLALFRVDVSC